MSRTDSRPTDDLRRGLPSGDERLGALNDIVLSAERGRDLVQRVLAFSRRAVSARMPVRVEAVVRESARLLRAGLPHAVEIAIDSTAPEATVLADPVELHQIVMNLGTNAAHAARVSTDVSSGIVTLVVSDTGEGMPPEVLAHAFAQDLRDGGYAPPSSPSPIAPPIWPQQCRRSRRPPDVQVARVHQLVEPVGDEAQAHDGQYPPTGVALLE